MTHLSKVRKVQGPSEKVSKTCFANDLDIREKHRTVTIIFKAGFSQPCKDARAKISHKCGNYCVTIHN